LKQQAAMMSAKPAFSRELDEVIIVAVNSYKRFAYRHQLVVKE
jgi:hypothetical protein